MTDVESLFRRIHRDPADESLFRRIWEVLQFAPACRHASEEELVSLAVDALDYLRANGRWTTASQDGRVELHLEGDRLHVYEDNDGTWHYRRTFAVGPGAPAAGQDPAAPDAPASGGTTAQVHPPPAP